MTDSYEVREVQDQETWDKLVGESSEGTVFSTSRWLECAQAAAGGRVRRLGCFKKSRLVGGCSFIEYRRSGFKKATTPLLTPYGGILTVPPNSSRPARIESERSKAIAELIGRPASGFHYVQLFHSTQLGDIREFLWARWSARVLYTYLIDLSDLDRLWNGLFEKRTNNAIRKAQKSGFWVRKEDEGAALVDLYERIYVRQGRKPPVSVRQVAAFYEAASSADLAQMYLAVDSKGNPSSACVVVPDGNTVYAWISGADPEADRLGASSLLYWKIFEDLGPSHKWFDFVGANMPAIAKFKRGFGGVLRTYYVTERYSSRVAAAALKGYGIVSRLLQR